MKADHLEVLAEEPSMEAFLREFLPRLIGTRATFEVHPYQGKTDMLAKLPGRLCGYAAWLPETSRIVVVVDRDDEDCLALKGQVEGIAERAGLLTRTAAAGISWRVVNRVVVEELEAWYFGDWSAVRAAFPRVSPNVPQKAQYRDPDAVQGGTWEAFERVLQRAGYFKSGLKKSEAARELGKRMDLADSRSRSFLLFRDAVLEAIT